MKDFVRPLLIMPLPRKRREVVDMVRNEHPNEAIRELCKWYGLETPVVTTPEDFLRANQYPWFTDMMFMFVEREELKLKFPTEYQELEKKVLASMPDIKTMEDYFAILGPAKARLLGMTFPDIYQGMGDVEEPVIVFSKLALSDPKIVLHEFWEYYPRKGKNRFEYHIDDPGRWVKRFLLFA